MEFTIENMRKGQWGKLIAFFDIKLTGYSTHFEMTVKGFKLVDGTKGIFVGMPSQKSDDEYHDTVYADEDTKNKIRDAAKKVYEEDDAVSDKDESVAGANDDLPF